jgi:hypothetical protein
VTVEIKCGCKTTNEGTARHPHEMLLPSNMCAEHARDYLAFHADSANERARARAALECAQFEDPWTKLLRGDAP